MKTDGSGQNKKDVPQTTLLSEIQRMTAQIGMALPKTITAERMARIAMTAVSNNPRLGQCERNSFFGALLTAAQLGLEPNTPLGQAYLIPYGNQCQFQLGYQGLIDLALRSDKYKNIQARVVYEGDVFDFVYGPDESLRHTPKGKSEKQTHVYAYYGLVNGGGTFEVMTWDQVMRHSETYSQAVKNGKNSPWASAPEEMAKKTVLKKLLKYAPKSVETGNAVATDEGFIHASVVKNGADAPILNTTVEFTDIPFTDVTDDKGNTPSNQPKADDKPSWQTSNQAPVESQGSSVTNGPTDKEVEEALLEEQYQNEQRFNGNPSGGDLNFDE